VFGGANFDGEMGPEYVRNFAQIDFAVIGEADRALPLLAAAISRGESPLGIPGVAGQDSFNRTLSTPSAPIRDMDQVPIPDYTDYFFRLRQLSQAKVVGRQQVSLLVEFSRGCWWGQKHHCTFCGLNALGMAYRSKSPKTAGAEILELAATYRELRIEVVDNIFDMRYLNEFCTELDANSYDFSLFFEVKANLTGAQLERLHRVGVRRIQPGLESLSTRVLKIMNKGTDLLTNVRLLKWARAYHIEVLWNILIGFPGENDDDYLGQAAIIPALHHLPPPTNCEELWLERFSPYFQVPPPEFRDIRPKKAYKFAYPIPGLDHSKIAYFFDYSAEKTVDPQACSALRAAVQEWRDRWQQRSRLPALFFQRGPGWVRIVDSRFTEPREAILEGWQARAYEECGNSARSVQGLARRLRAQPGLRQYPTETDLRDFVSQCVGDQFMIADRDHYLSLALPTRRGCGG